MISSISESTVKVYPNESSHGKGISSFADKPNIWLQEHSLIMRLCAENCNTVRTELQYLWYQWFSAGNTPKEAIHSRDSGATIGQNLWSTSEGIENLLTSLIVNGGHFPPHPIILSDS